MPAAHRNNDSRACGATTIVSGQSTVFVNNILWAVENDLDTHCAPQGPLMPINGTTVFCENKNVIVVGDSFHAIDLQPPDCLIPHSPTASTGSSDTSAY